MAVQAIARNGETDMSFAGELGRNRPEAHLPKGAHMTLITTPPGLVALEAGWRALETAHARPHNVFQTYDWVSGWSQAYAGPGGENSIAIVAGLRDGKLAFVLPLMQVQIGPLAVLRWLTEPLAQYGDVLIDRPEDLDGWMNASLAFIRREVECDTIWLRHVRDDAAVAPWVAANFCDAQLTQKAPWLDLSAFADEAAYDQRYDSQQRKRRKKIRKTLEADLGPVAFKVLDHGPERKAAMALALAEKNKWIEERGRQNQVLGCPRLIRFLDSLSGAQGSTRMVVSCCQAGDTPVSWEIGLRFGATHFAFITSHATALTDYSPGRLHMDQSQRLALDAGMKVFDLMVPYDPHKESWSSAMMRTRDFYLPLSSRGWLFGKLYLSALRPVIRATYYRLPKGALKALKPIIGH